jgi:hypothetical protein
LACDLRRVNLREPAVLAELVGETYAKAVQLRLEYAPDPPFQSGRPELAPPEVLELVRQGFGRAGGTA